MSVTPSWQFEMISLAVLLVIGLDSVRLLVSTLAFPLPSTLLCSGTQEFEGIYLYNFKSALNQLGWSS